MNILFVTARPLELNTSSTIRNKAYINGFLQLGFDVVVVTLEADKNHNNYEEFDSYLKDNIQQIKISSGKLGEIKSFVRSNIFLKKLRVIGYKLFSMISIYELPNSTLKSVSQMKIDLDKFDTVISSSDPKSSHEIARNLLIKKNIPWIQIWGDPFYSDITRRNKFFNRKIKKKENELLALATKVVYVSPLTLINQKKVFPEFSTKMFYVPTPFIKEKKYNRTSSKDRLKFLYLGDYFSHVRDIRPLHKAFLNSKHLLTICGDSDIKIEICDNIYVSRRVSYRDTQKLITDCDVLIHLSNLKGSQIPGKIFHYSSTNKPILFILDGDNKNEIKLEFQKYNRYIFCNNDPDSINSLIENLSDKLNESIFEPVQDFSSVNCVKKLIS